MDNAILRFCFSNNFTFLNMSKGIALIRIIFLFTVPTPDPILDNFELGSEKFGAPLIIPSEPDVTLEAATDFTLTCRSKKPVTWRFPEIMVEYEITAFEKSGSSLPYGSSLFLRDVQVENVGKYYCLETEFNSTNDAQLDILLTLYKAETIYLFVNGKLFYSIFLYEFIFRSYIFCIILLDVETNFRSF